ncbi:MAG: hypothetical protein ACKO1N_02675 [Erythrobacter sp.]
MHLPLKFGVSGPLTSIMAVALVGSLFTAEGRKVHVIYGFPNAIFFAFFAGAAALLFVPPNLFATMLANRLGADGPARFFGIFFLGSVTGFFAMAVALNGLFRTMGGLVRLSDWRTYAAVLANAALLGLIAFFFGTRHE